VLEVIKVHVHSFSPLLNDSLKQNSSSCYKLTVLSQKFKFSQNIKNIRTDLYVIHLENFEKIKD